DGCTTTLDLALQSIPRVEIISASSAEAALAELARNAIRALITDVRLPEMTGLELIERVRGEPRFQALPIIVVSADTDPAMPAQALKVGANAFFSKPFSPGAVRKKVEELIDES